MQSKQGAPSGRDPLRSPRSRFGEAGRSLGEASKEVPRRTLKEKQQVVAGFVVFRRTEDGIKYLLLYKRGNYWNFPKGHFETGENSMATALRETEEETGIRRAELRIVPNFKAYERFRFTAGGERIHDTVILYLAETKQANVRIAPREHSGFAWFLYHDALSILGKKYVGTKNVLKQANDFIRGKRPAPRPTDRITPVARLGTDADKAHSAQPGAGQHAPTGLEATRASGHRGSPVPHHRRPWNPHRRPGGNQHQSRP